MIKNKIYRFDTKKMVYVIDKKLYIKIIIFIVLLPLLGFLISEYNHYKNMNDVDYISEENKVLIINESNKFSEEKLRHFILELNIKFPHIVLAQAKLESGHFKSKMFLTNNNFFGMKVARKRPTTNKGEQYGHAYYESWKDCVVDYAFYQAAYLNNLKTEEQYFNYLSLNYAEDSSYVQKLKWIIKNK